MKPRKPTRRPPAPPNVIPLFAGKPQHRSARRDQHERNRRHARNSRLADLMAVALIALRDASATESEIVGVCVSALVIHCSDVGAEFDMDEVVEMLEGAYEEALRDD